jgi:glycopeptide antibiotics resistance protein
VVVFGCYLVAVGVLTLDPSQQAPGRSLSLVSALLQAVGLPVLADSRVLEVASNVALFVPFGLLGLLSWPSLRVLGWTALGALLSAAIELSQLLFLPHRFATVSDLVANTTGAMLGALVATAVRRVLVRREGLPPHVSQTGS